MRSTGSLAEAVTAAVPYPSLSALRSVHNDLLKRQVTAGGAPELIEAAEDFVRRGRETGALLDNSDDRWSAQSALDYWAAALYRFDRREVEATLAELDPGLAPELDDALCPYVGLEAFRESQHQVFFGRSRLLADLVALLAGNRRLVVVLGSSGSGKSSMVLGGLLPALKSGALPGSEDWHYPPHLVPGSEPLRNLVYAFLPAGAEAEAWLASQSERFAREPEQHLVRLAAERGGGAPTVLVVDQFEEIFTLCEDNRIRQAFITGLLSLLRTAAPQHRVVLTMRIDFEAKVNLFPELQPFWEAGKLPVSQLSAAELREAIEKPAERVGLKFEEGVVPELLNDLLGEQAGLPLLQFTLLKLWEKRKRNRVTWAAYRQLGGGRAALAKCADELYEDLKLPENQLMAKHILLRMVRPDAGMEFTSNRIRRASLDKISEDRDRIARVLDRLVKAHLVRLTLRKEDGDAQVEVAHEALVRNWQRLNDWLQEAREKEATRRRLEVWAADWVRAGRGPLGLLYGSQLSEAEAWLASPEAAEVSPDQQVTALVRASRRWRLLRKTVFWICVLLPVLLWGLAKRDLTKIQLDKTRIEQEKNDAVNERDKANAEAESTRKLAADIQSDVIEKARQADEKLRQAEDKSRQADEKVREAKEDAARTVESAKNRADKVTNDSWTLVSQHQNEIVVLQGRTQQLQDQANQAITQAEEANVKAVTLEARTQTAEQRWKDLEQELVDGGGNKKSPGALKLINRAWKTITSRFELREFRRSQRPVLAGASVGIDTRNSLTGTICCLVRDAEGVYLLSRASIFSIPDAPILQPSRDDGPVARFRNTVADVVRTSGANANRAAAIARLRSGIAVEPQTPDGMKIVGIAENLPPGTEVLLVGRGSGRKSGSVLRTDADGTVITDIRPTAGDTGGPLLTPDGRLVGMLWGWSDTGRESYFAPIGPILKELEVELVTAQRY